MRQAVAAALYARANGAPGRRINASLMEAAANLQAIRMMGSYRDGDLKAATAPSGTYQGSDGRWLQIGALKNHEFKGTCKVLGFPEMADDPRFADHTGRVAHAAYLVGRVAAVIKTKTAAEWRDTFTAAGLQNELLQSYREFVTHPHTAATGLIEWTVQPGSDQPWATPNIPGTPRLEPGTPEALCPALGQHTREILSELGYQEADIAKMIGVKAVFE